MKRLLTNLILTGLAAVTFVSCSNSERNTTNDIPLLYQIEYAHNNQTQTIPSIIDTVEFIPLYGSADNPISHVDELQVCEDGIFILDKKRNILHVYGKDGNRLFTLNSLGHAEQEYLEIACFAVTDSSIFVVDNFGKKVNEYSSDNGIFKRCHPTPIVIGGIRPTKNGNFILAELPLEGVNQLENSDGHRLYIADNSFRIKSSFYPYNKLRDKIGMGRLFSDNDSVIIYSSTGYNGFTEISAKDGSIIGNVSVNTANPFKNDAIAEMGLSEAMDFVEKQKWQFLTTTPISTLKYLCLSIKDNDTAEPCIYDTKSNELFFNDKLSMYNNIIAPDDAYSDSFYTVYNFGGEFLDEQLNMGFNRPSQVADSIIRNNGTVLLRYKMKQ